MVLEVVDKSLRVWEAELGVASKGTQKMYRYYFGLFLKRWDLTVDGAYRVQLETLQSQDPRDRRRVENMVALQMSEMRGAGGSVSACQLLRAAVTHFYVSQGLEIRLRTRDMPRGEDMGKRLVLHEQIRSFYDSPGLFTLKRRNRAILMVGKDSGFRVSDLAGLNVAHYLEAEDVRSEKGERFKVLRPYVTQKTKGVAYPHLGPEAVEAVEAYLAERRRKTPMIPPESPLFLSMTGKRMSPNMLSQVVERMCGRLDQKKTNISAHSLRKFHTTMLESVMPRSWVAKLQGKKLNDSMSPYSRPEELEGELTRKYMEGYDRLRVFRSDTVPVEKLRELSDRVKVLGEKEKEILQLREDVQGLSLALAQIQDAMAQLPRTPTKSTNQK